MTDQPKTEVESFKSAEEFWTALEELKRKMEQMRVKREPEPPEPEGESS